MICESGDVVAVDDGWVWIETRRNNACAACSARAGCGQGFLNGAFGGKRHYIKVPVGNFQGRISLHDKVEIEIPENAMLTGSFLVYLLPLLLMIAGAVVGQNYSGSESDAHAIVGASIGFIVAGVIVRRHSVRHQANPAYQPVLSRIIETP